jgi:raffinose/stachyose/melibiose transport system permease protein
MRMKKLKMNPWPWIVTLPALLLYLLFVLYPAIGNIYFSFTDYNGNIDRIDWVGLDNYRKAFTSDWNGVWNAIKITIIFCLLVTIVQNFVSVVLAVAVNLKLKLRNFYRSVIFLPNILGVLVVGLVWKLIFDPYLGPVNKLLQQFGWNSALFGDRDVALYLVIFVAIWANMGYSMILYLAGLQGIPKEIYEAGRIDGTTGWSALFLITLPLLRPIITINVLICLIGSLSIFDIVFVLTNGGPGNSTMTLGMYIFKNLFSGQSQGYASALSIIHFFIILLVVLICQHYLRRRETEM